MPRVLVIHHDKAARDNLVSLAQRSHQVEAAPDLVSGAKQMARSRPDVILVSQDREKAEALRLLKYMRDNVLKTPVVVVLARGSGSVLPALLKLGAKGVIEVPVEPQRLNETIAAAIAARKAAEAGPPPITDEELSQNLSALEGRLNRAMKCFAGKNQVFMQSQILGVRTSRPRVALRCALRPEYGLSKEVFYEYIRDVCCGDPEACEALQRFRADQRETA